DVAPCSTQSYRHARHAHVRAHLHTCAFGTPIALRRDPTIARDLSFSERPMAKDRIYETDEGIRIAQLSALDDFEVAEGYPDIRGWTVASTDGQEVGKVHDLLIDVDHMRTRYLDVRLTKELAASPSDRDDAVRDEVRRDVIERDAVERDAVQLDAVERDVRARESESRVPVEREDAVVLKRGEDGRDEIIIRRPIGEGRSNR